MQDKKQFHITAERRTFFDRKVLHYGSSRTVAIGKIIPADWPYVRMTILAKKDNTITVQLDKLFMGVSHARDTKTNKTSG